MSHCARNPNAEEVAQYVLSQCSQRHGFTWLGSRSPEDFTPRDEEFRLIDVRRWADLGVAFNDRIVERLTTYQVTDIADLLVKFQLKGVREDSRQGLLGWLENRYPLHLTHRPPPPEEMLELQARGERVVTWHREDNGPIGRHAGPFEFLLHDLEHAQKFFGGGSFKGQRRFFNLLYHAWQADLFTDLCRNSKFRTELEYLMADMNSHPLHLLKYLKAIVLEAMPEKRVAELDRWCEDLFLIWRLPDPVRDAARRINYPALENNEARLRVSDFFAYT